MVSKNKNSRDKKGIGYPKARRCQFTMPEEDVVLIERLRKRFQEAALPESETSVEIAKSEIVRAGLRALDLLTNKELEKIVKSVEKLPEGRRRQE